MALPLIPGPYTEIVPQVRALRDALDPLVGGGGDVYEDTAYASLSAAVTAIGSAVSTLRISTSLFPNGATCTVPSTLLIDWVGAGSLTITTGQTVTIQSDGSNWPIRKIFYNAVATQGTVSFSGNITICKGYPQWWGAVNWGGTSATDAQPAIQAAVNAFKTGGDVVITRGSDFALYSQVTADGAVLLTVKGEPTAPLSTHSASTSPIIRWKGADGGKMFSFTSSHNCVVEGIHWVSLLTAGATGADRVLDFDGPGFTSAHTVRNNQFDNQNQNPDFIAVNVAANSGLNNEFFQIHNNNFYVGGAGEAYLANWLVDDGSITAATNTVSTALAGYFDHTAFGGAYENWVGLPIRISKAGTAGATFESVITAVSGDGKTATLANNAITTTTSGRIFVGKGYGTAIEFGSSANIKNMYLSHNNILFAHYGVRIKNGSAIIDDINGGFNDYDLYVDNFVDSLNIINMNTEGSHCGVYVGAGTASLTFDVNRGSNSAQFNEGYWQFGGFPALNMRGNSIEGAPQTGATIFTFTNRNIRVISRSMRLASNVTLAQLGWSAFADDVHADSGNTGFIDSSDGGQGVGISDAPAPHFIIGGGGAIAVLSQYSTGLLATVRPFSGATDFIALRGIFENNPARNLDRAIGVSGEITASACNASGIETIGVRSLFPPSLGNHGGGSIDYYLFKGVAPTTGAGNARDAYGLHLSAHPGSGITGQRYGIYQAGAADINVFAGPRYFNTAKTVGEFIGTGSPESVVTANIGSTYRRTDGGAGTSFYVKESGTGSTGWIGK